MKIVIDSKYESTNNNRFVFYDHKLLKESRKVNLNSTTIVPRSQQKPIVCSSSMLRCKIAQVNLLLKAFLVVLLVLFILLVLLKIKLIGRVIGKVIVVDVLLRKYLVSFNLFLSFKKKEKVLISVKELAHPQY